MQRTDSSPTLSQVVVTLTPEQVDTAFAEISRQVLRGAALPGFRPGRAPRARLERAHAGRIVEGVREQLLRTSVGPALAEARLQPVGTPELVAAGQTARGAMFTYTLRCHLMPPVVLAKTAGLRLQASRREVDDAALEARLQRLREEAAAIEPVVGRDVVESGDWVVLSYTTEKDGKNLPSLAGQDVTLDTADPDLEPALVAAVVGSRVPGPCDCTLTLSASAQPPALAGQPVRMRAQLKELKARVLPALDDALAQDLGHPSLEALRAAVRAELGQEAGREADQAERAALAEALVAANPIEVPSILIDQELDQSLARLQSRLGRLGPGGDGAPQREQLAARLRPAVEQRVKATLLLLELARAEKIVAEAAEVDAAVAAKVAEAGEQGGRVRAFYDDPDHRRDLEAELVNAAALRWLRERAEVVPPTQAPAAPAVATP